MSYSLSVTSRVNHLRRFGCIGTQRGEVPASRSPNSLRGRLTQQAGSIKGYWVLSRQMCDGYPAANISLCCGMKVPVADRDTEHTSEVHTALVTLVRALACSAARAWLRREVDGAHVLREISKTRVPKIFDTR